MKILVYGSGYVGLITSVALASIDHDVVCIDIDQTKIEKLKRREATIFEKDLQKYLIKTQDKLTFDYFDARHLDTVDVIIIAVGTPEKSDGSANLSYVYETVNQIIDYIDHSCVVIIKSTVPIGVNDRIQELFDNALMPEIKIDVVSNPEFLSQGTAISDVFNGGRIVIGSNSDHARKIMAEMYRPLGQKILFTDRRSAEMIKYASNDFLALKISYINEIANLCESLGANIDDVALGVGLDHRIGEKFLKAGIGYGGSCFPKDTKALQWLGMYHNSELKTVKAAIEVNEKQKLLLIQKARKYMPSLRGTTVAVLGLAFKPGTDDLREAPSLTNIPILLHEGADVRVWDPYAGKNFKAVYGDIVSYSHTIEEALNNADLALIMTEFSEICALDPRAYTLMNSSIVLDGRNCYKPEIMGDIVDVYDSVGRAVTGKMIKKDLKELITV